MTNRRNFIYSSAAALVATTAIFPNSYFGEEDVDVAKTTTTTIDTSIPDHIRNQVEKYGGHSLEWHVENAKCWPIFMRNRFILVDVLNKSELRKNCDDIIIEPFSIGLFPQLKMSEVRYKYLNADETIKPNKLYELHDLVSQHIINMENQIFRNKSSEFIKTHLLAIKHNFNNIPVLNMREMRIGWICYEEFGWIKKDDFFHISS